MYYLDHEYRSVLSLIKYGITLLHLGVVEQCVAELVGIHSQYCKARVPCGRLSTLAP